MRDEIREWLADGFNPHVVDIESPTSDAAAREKVVAYVPNLTPGPNLTAALTADSRQVGARQED